MRGCYDRYNNKEVRRNNMSKEAIKDLALAVGIPAASLAIILELRILLGYV